MNKQIKITLTEKTLTLLEKEAAIRGIKPAVLARIKLNEIFAPEEIDINEKAYIVPLKNWREVEAYARIKSKKTVEEFAIDAVNALMKRNALTPLQKAELERIIGK